MNKIEELLFRTRKTVRQAAEECDLDIEDVELYELEQCSSCSIWLKFPQLKDDMDGNPICRNCWEAYGD
jgi:hypothetical protein